MNSIFVDTFGVKVGAVSPFYIILHPKKGIIINQATIYMRILVIFLNNATCVVIALLSVRHTGATFVT